MAARKEKLLRERKDADASGALKKDSDSIQDRIHRYDYTDEQLAEARAGMEAGLSEEQILAYFQLDCSVDKMRVLRMLL